jgi:hypothetical protein
MQTQSEAEVKGASAATVLVLCKLLVEPNTTPKASLDKQQRERRKEHLNIMPILVLRKKCINERCRDIYATKHNVTVHTDTYIPQTCQEFTLYVAKEPYQVH